MFILKKSFILEKKKYFEIVLLNASDYSSKFDRIVVFSNKYVLPNYAIKASFYDSTINIFERDVQIKILNMWEVSIRSCEIAKFLSLVGKSKAISYSNTTEYYGLMKFLTQNQCTINDLIRLDDREFERLRTQIIGQGKNTILMDAIADSRDIILHNRDWKNTLSYPLFRLLT